MRWCITRRPFVKLFRDGVERRTAGRTPQRLPHLFKKKAVVKYSLQISNNSFPKLAVKLLASVRASNLKTVTTSSVT